MGVGVAVGVGAGVVAVAVEEEEVKDVDISDGGGTWARPARAEPGTRAADKIKPCRHLY